MFSGLLHIYLGERLLEADSKNTEVTSQQRKCLMRTSMLLEGGAHFSSFLGFIDGTQTLKNAEM